MKVIYTFLRDSGAVFDCTYIAKLNWRKTKKIEKVVTFGKTAVHLHPMEKNKI